MRRLNKTLSLVICCGVIAVAACVTAFADPVIMSGQSANESTDSGPAGGPEEGSTWATATVVTGPVLQINDDYILIDSVSDTAAAPVGMVSLRIDPDLTLIVDGNSGYPASLSDIKVNDTVYAYVGAAMTLSLPPQLSASMIICDLPADGSVPIFTKVESLTDNGDGTYKLTVAGGGTYMLPDNCQISPFRTRNIVTFSDITPGSNCLLWADIENTVTKVVIIQQ